MHEWGTTLWSAEHRFPVHRRPLASVSPNLSRRLVVVIRQFPLVGESLHSSHAAAEPTADWVSEWLTAGQSWGGLHKFNRERGSVCWALALHIHEEITVSPPPHIGRIIRLSRLILRALWRWFGGKWNSVKLWPAVILIIVDHHDRKPKHYWVMF